MLTLSHRAGLPANRVSALNAKFSGQTKIGVLMKLNFCVAFVLMMACEAGSGKEAEEPQYSLKSYGGLRDASRSAEAVWEFIPFNRTYNELSEAQKLSLSSLYFDMGSLDEPPFPVNGLAAIYGPITEAQVKLGVTGSFRAELVIGSDGVVQEVRVYKSPNKTVTRFISELALLTPFKPAKCAGAPCRMNFPLIVRFDMQ